MTQHILSHGILATAEGLRVAVYIVERKDAYGVARYVVRPVTGGMETATVNANRVTLTPTVED